MIDSIRCSLESKNVSVHYRTVQNAVGNFCGGLVRNLQMNSIHVPILSGKERQNCETAIRLFRNRCIDGGNVIGFVICILNQLE